MDPVDMGCKIAKTTKEVLPLTTNSLDKAGSTIINVINTILTPFDMANLYAENAKKNFAHKLQPKMDKIPKEKRCEPKLSTIGPIIDSLKYNLNEEYLHDMYTNLLSKACNKDFSKNILPVYAEILKQFTPLSAKIFSNLNTSFFLMTCNIRDSNTKKIISSLHNIYLDDDFTEVDIDIPVSVNNLERLGLLYIVNNIGSVIIDGNHLPLINKFKKTQYYKNQTKLYGKDSLELISQPGKISELGLNFKKICLY